MSALKFQITDSADIMISFFTQLLLLHVHSSAHAFDMNFIPHPDYFPLSHYLIKANIPVLKSSINIPV